MLALSVVVLFFASVVPGIELSLLALSGALVMIVVSETSMRGGIVFYAASVILSFLIIPNKSTLLLYAFIFGSYSIIKTLIERNIHRKIPMYIVKLISFNILLGGGFFIFKEAFFSSVGLPDMAWYILLAGAQMLFLMYDVLLTLIVRLYYQLIPQTVRGEGKKHGN